MAGVGDGYSVKISVSLDSSEARAGLEQLADQLAEVRNSTGGALGNIGKHSDDLIDSLDNLDASLGRTTRGLGAAGLAGAAVIAIPLLLELGRRVKEAWEEHERLQALAERLDLPTREVKDYSDTWRDVAISLDDVAKGFARLSDSQALAFDALDLDKLGGAKAIREGLTRIAASTGSREDKITALRILTGRSYEEMAEELDDEIKRLNTKVWGIDSSGRTISMRRAEREGVQFGREDVGQLLSSGAIVAPETLRAKEEAQQLAEKAERERVLAAEEASRELIRLRREEAEAFAESIEITVEHQRVAVDQIAEVYDRWDKETMSLTERQAAYLYEFQSKLDELLKVNRITAEEYGERWSEALESQLKEVVVTHKKLGDGLSDLQIAVRDEITDPIKAGLHEMRMQGEFSIKSLVRNVTAALLERQLYKAIENLGNALADALNPGSGGGIGGFLGGLLVGSAGGGFRDRAGPLAEDGPELLVPTSGGVRVLNQRQLAFAAGNGGGSPMAGGGGAFAPVYAPVYNISGVDTQAVIGYVESTRRSDQERWVKTMYDNGFGRLK